MSLPPRPNVYPTSQPPYVNLPAINPFTHAYSSHYAQAYMQNYPPQPLTTPEGYTYSSAYSPAAHYTSFTSPQYGTSPRPARPSIPAANTTWYQPGNVRCTHQNCTFTGSSKSVEIHMMDRHLIYPPGWEKRKKNQDWDADPSLKGKPIPIQGTKILLDTPAAVEAWVAERKKRWPTSGRVEEKKRKLEEATARGQLTVEELGLFSKKRRRVEDDNHGNNNGRGRGMRGRGRGGRRGVSDFGPRGRVAVNEKHREEITKPEASHTSTSTPQAPTLPLSNTADSSSSEDSDDDSEPEVVSSKVDILPRQHQNTETLAEEQELAKETKLPVLNRQPRQPKKPPPNPFAPKTSLLRNLLLPEIRMTVSNLSQAIRFIVDNDFLRDVEMKPGEANERLIKVVGSSTIATDSQPSLS